MPELIVEPIVGHAILDHCEALAELRIRVFREWPYLYDGSPEYERDYLENYSRSAHGIIVIAREGRKVVGVSTGLPLCEANAEFQVAFQGTDYAIGEIYYFGESVLLPEYRGRGLGHAFFEHREAKARAYGACYAAFCAVQREYNDPRRPEDYRPLDPFWTRKCFKHEPHIRASLSWREIDQSVDSLNSLSFWIKKL
ncbi:GNAT family N-acetyltransferase [Coraliomargarita parva]|uniref:GNAT family N-acetyltransferase n=1 Tax=Coraliomargarita parva TaxID=3014050 RepID=UPI0022B4DC52|nr:GNAT family N-acetyltransferase [Coraliomargarita parva]